MSDAMTPLNSRGHLVTPVCPLNGIQKEEQWKQWGNSAWERGGEKGPFVWQQSQNPTHSLSHIGNRGRVKFIFSGFSKIFPRSATQSSSQASCQQNGSILHAEAQLGRLAISFTTNQTKQKKLLWKDTAKEREFWELCKQLTNTAATLIIAPSFQQWAQFAMLLNQYGMPEELAVVSGEAGVK